MRNAAEWRRSLARDKYVTATQDILASNPSIDLYYHTTCNSQYSAVKRKASNDDKDPQSTSTASTSTRSKSDLPQTDVRGVLQHSCIFCSTERKRFKSCSKDSSFEKLHKVETIEQSNLLIKAAKSKSGLRSSQQILSLGSEDLVAKEAHFHNTCMLKFLQESKAHIESSTHKNISVKRKHDKTFEEFVTYIEQEVIQKRVPKYASKLMDLYKEKFREMWGGEDEDIESYLSQCFIRKIQNRFGDKLMIKKESNKDGNFLYSRGMSFDEAKLHLKNVNHKEDEIRRAALILRSEILQMETTKMPTPTSIQSLKDNAPDIQPLTKMFYQTLTSGLSPLPGEAAQMRAQSMVSDAVFNTSRGLVRPWKQTSLGLGLSSMLGSKTAVTVLNRLGHTVNYYECKRLETEIAYTCSSGDQEMPAGLNLEPSLATGML